MAQDYFKHFPTIDFDLKNDGNLIEAKDIFRNIRVAEDAEEAQVGLHGEAQPILPWSDWHCRKHHHHCLVTEVKRAQLVQLRTELVECDVWRRQRSVRGQSAKEQQQAEEPLELEQRSQPEQHRLHQQLSGQSVEPEPAERRLRWRNDSRGQQTLLQVEGKRRQYD